MALVQSDHGIFAHAAVRLDSPSGSLRFVFSRLRSRAAARHIGCNPCQAVVAYLLHERGAAVYRARSAQPGTAVNATPLLGCSAGWLGVNGGASEIEHNARLITSYPGIVSWGDDADFAWAHLGGGAVVHLDGQSS